MFHLAVTADRAPVAEEMEREQMLALLHRKEWKVATVARAIGRSRVTVYKRMRELGITRAMRRD